MPTSAPKEISPSCPDSRKPKLRHAYLLRALLVNDLCVVLRLTSVFPHKVNNEPSAAFVFASVNGIDFILPRSCWRTPFIRCRWGRRFARMCSVSLGALCIGSLRCAGRTAALLAFGSFVCLLKYLFSPAYRFEVARQNIAC